MAKYSSGSMSAEDLIKQFGLQTGGDVGPGFNAKAGASDDDQTKQNKLLGDGYLTNEQYEELKDSDEIRQAYSDLHGQEAAAKKFKDGFISINTMDALFDDLSAEKAAEKAEKTPEVQEPIQLSRPAATAKARAQAYKDTMMIRDGDYIIGNDPTVIADFNDQVIKNTEYELQPKMPNELHAARKEAAQERANNYKLAVADQLKSDRGRLELQEIFKS